MRPAHWLYTIPLRLRSLFRRSQVEQELDAELQYHLAQRIAEETAKGVPDEEARQLALRALKGIEQRKEECRDARHTRWIEDLIQDLCHAFRMLRKSPAFMTVAVLSLTLGIGANTAVFTVINAVLLRSLPVQHPEQLVRLTHADLRRSGMKSFPYPLYREMRDRNEPISDVICQTAMFPSLSYGRSAERVTGEMVSGNYFSALGVQPYAGRLLNLNDETAAERVVVLSYEYWKRRFGGDGSIVGKTVSLNTFPMTVIGIAPPEYASLQAMVSPDVRVPVTLKLQMQPGPSQLETRNDWWLTIAGRLRPGLARGQAEAALTLQLRNYLAPIAGSEKISDYRKRLFQSEHVALLPAAAGLESRATNAAEQLWFLMVVVSLVLLIACVNIANLLLARTAARQREIAVRLSLGAEPGRIVRQLMTENLLLSGMGALFGIAFANWGARLLLAFIMAGQRGAVIDVTPDARVLGFTAGVAVLTAILFGLAPAIGSTRFELAPELKGSQTRIRWTRIPIRKLLISAQVAFSLLLVIGAGWFLRSLARLQDADLGFDKTNVLVVSLDPTQAGYSQDQARAFYRRFAEEVAHLPGVRDASYAGVGLLTDSGWGSGIAVEGFQTREDDPGPDRNVVGPRYFSTLRIPLIRGRDFTEHDNATSPHVAVIDESFARFYFRSIEPIGKHIGPGGPPERTARPDYTIIGVAKDLKYANLREHAPRFWYIPYEQNNPIRGLTMYVRTEVPPMNAMPAVQNTARAIDSNVALYGFKTLEEQMATNIGTDRMVAALSAFFAGLGVIIAAVGLYGVMAYLVTRRTREIGIRMALGARPSRVIRAVLGEAVVLVVAGVVLGVPAALALGRYVASMLYQVKPGDLATLIGACLFILIAGIAAGYLPARRASRVDPMEALRCE